MHVTQEVHVRRSATGALVLHQEVAEDQLVPVLLLHHHQLRGGERERGGGRSQREKLFLSRKGRIKSGNDGVAAKRKEVSRSPSCIATAEL